MMALPKCVCGQDKHICIDCIEVEVERLREELEQQAVIIKAAKAYIDAEMEAMNASSNHIMHGRTAMDKMWLLKEALEGGENDA